jgi:hypothetical protein
MMLIIILQTVGVMGWFTGGGHGPLSSDYGMGADNVLEATVLLPSGELVTTNACQYPDLFYAIRGGGGSTYGIILSAVLKAHPTPQTTHHTLFMTTKHRNASTQFYQTAASILAEFPTLKEEGMQGYFAFDRFDTWGNQVLSLNWGFYLYNKPNGTVERLLEPIKLLMERENASLTYFSRISSAPSFFKQYKKAPGAEPVASMGSMGGWLLPKSALMNTTRLSKMLETIGPSMDGPAVCNIQRDGSIPNTNNRGIEGDARYRSLFLSQGQQRS